MLKLSFFQKLRLCWFYPTFYLFITIFTNVFVYSHSNYLADEGIKINRGSYTYTFTEWGRVQSHFIDGNIDLYTWISSNGDHLRSIFAFNRHTEYYLKYYNSIDNLDNIKLFDILRDIGVSTMKSSFAPIYEIVIGRNFLLYTPLYSFILFSLLASAMVRRWQFLSFLEKDDSDNTNLLAEINESRALIEKTTPIQGKKVDPPHHTNNEDKIEVNKNNNNSRNKENVETRNMPVIDPDFN